MALLVTVESYDYPFQAQFAKTILEQAGIHCALENETLVSFDWFLSNAVGGVKVQVRPEDAEAASKILAELRAKSATQRPENSDSWVVLRCSSCKKHIAFAGIQRECVENCPRCGRYVDVTTESDPSIDEQTVQATIAEIKKGPISEGSLFHTKSFLIFEIGFVLLFAWFLDFTSGFNHYQRQVEFGIEQRESIGRFSAELCVRSFVVLGGMFFLLWMTQTPLRQVGITLRRLVPDVGLGILAGLILVPIFIYLESFSPEPIYGFYTIYRNDVSITDTVPFVVLFGLILLLNSLAESVVMQGYLINRLTKLAMYPAIAIGLSSLLFGSYHIYRGLTGFVATTIFGFLMGIWFVRTQRLTGPIVAHTMYNAFAICQTAYVEL